MASQSRKYRGYASERYVQSFLQQWWPNASVGRGADPAGDILNVPFDIEIKSRNKLDISGTLRQIKARTSKSGKLGFACFRLNGMGEQAVERYVCMLEMADLVQLLVQAGYDKIPAQLNPIRCDKCGDWVIQNMECKTCAKI